MLRYIFCEHKIIYIFCFTTTCRCRNATYPEELPSASVIICFYNEHFQTLLRTLHSIIDRTPKHLLEIILVDDYSNVAGLHDKLQLYVEHHFKNEVKFFKTDRREGLIRARLFGSKRAKGDVRNRIEKLKLISIKFHSNFLQVIVFLDSHVEVNVDWLPPLLSRVRENRTNVALPIIDIINSDTFSYTSSPLVRGGFNWGLHFKWENLPTGVLLLPSGALFRNVFESKLSDRCGSNLERVLPNYSNEKINSYGKCICGNF